MSVSMSVSVSVSVFIGLFSYRHINKRLRKMNRPSMEFHSNLSIRANIETEMDTIICQCGFEKVNFQDQFKSGQKRKAWDRKILLYQRIP